MFGSNKALYGPSLVLFNPLRSHPLSRSAKAGKRVRLDAMQREPIRGAAFSSSFGRAGPVQLRAKNGSKKRRPRTGRKSTALILEHFFLKK
jgi:hypothetical protein